MRSFPHHQLWTVRWGFKIGRDGRARIHNHGVALPLIFICLQEYDISELEKLRPRTSAPRVFEVREHWCHAWTAVNRAFRDSCNLKLARFVHFLAYADIKTYARTKGLQKFPAELERESKWSTLPMAHYVALSLQCISCRFKFKRVHRQYRIRAFCASGKRRNYCCWNGDTMSLSCHMARQGLLHLSDKRWGYSEGSANEADSTPEREKVYSDPPDFAKMDLDMAGCFS